MCSTHFPCYIRSFFFPYIDLGYFDEGEDFGAVTAVHATDFGGVLSDKEVMMLCNISRNTYYKYK